MLDLGTKILIVDDAACVRTTMSNVLVGVGYRVRATPKMVSPPYGRSDDVTARCVYSLSVVGRTTSKQYRTPSAPVPVNCPDSCKYGPMLIVGAFSFSCNSPVLCPSV